MAQPANVQATSYQPAEAHQSAGGRLTDADPPLMLALAELVQDDAGEVVLFNDSGLRSLALSTADAVSEEGQVGRHVTAAGEDVSGFRFIAFANGLKLFYQPGLDILLVDEAGAAD